MRAQKIALKSKKIRKRVRKKIVTRTSEISTRIRLFLEGPQPRLLLLALGILFIVLGQILLSKNLLRDALLSSFSGAFLVFGGWTLRIRVRSWLGKFHRTIKVIKEICFASADTSPTLTRADRRVNRRGLSLVLVSAVFLIIAVYLLKDGRLELELRYSLESLGIPLVLIALSIILLGFSILIPFRHLRGETFGPFSLMRALIWGTIICGPFASKN